MRHTAIAGPLRFTWDTTQPGQIYKLFPFKQEIQFHKTGEQILHQSHPHSDTNVHKYTSSQNLDGWTELIALNQLQIFIMCTFLFVHLYH